MHATLIALGLKLGDMPMWQRFFHSKLGITLASVVLGIIGTLGFAPYQLWVVTLITLGFEFFFVATLKSPKQAFFSLWLYFTAINAATLSWLNFVMSGFGQMPIALSWLMEILLSAYLAFFHGLLGCLAFKLAHRYLKNKQANAQHKQAADDDEYADEDLDDADYDAADNDDNKDKSQQSSSSQAATAPAQLNNDKGTLHFYKNAFLLAFLPVALILADYISGWLFTGFPWMYIGYTAIEGPFSAYAPLIGVRGITLVMFISAGALALTLERRYVYLPVAGVLFAIGIFCQGLNFTQNLPAIKVTGVQGNVMQQIKWDPRQVLPIINHYVNQTMPYFGRSDLIIWPESALPVFAQEVQHLLDDLNTVSYHKQTPLLTGLQHADFADNAKLETFNTIYLLGTSPNLNDVQIYKKRQLVPFGEQVPFEKYTRKLGSIFNFPMSGFTAGEYKQEQFKITLNATHANLEEVRASQEGGSIVDTLARTKTNLENNERKQANAKADNKDSAALTETATAKDSTAELANNAINKEVSSKTAEGTTDNAAIKETVPTVQDNFIDENAHTGFAEEDGAGLAQEPQSLDTHTPSNTGVNAPNDELLSKEMHSNEEMQASELFEGEEEWFSSEIPVLPSDISVPLEQPLTLSFIPAICYESIFPELMTSLHDENTNGIIMISNDSWFGNTRGPDEHLGIARMRSLEMQKPMIRITNSGHTVLIDKSGQIVDALPQDKTAIIHTDFVPNQGMTPYVRFSNVPLYVILVLLCFIGWYLRSKEVNTLQQNLEALVRP